MPSHSSTEACGYQARTGTATCMFLQILNPLGYDFCENTVLSLIIIVPFILKTDDSYSFMKYDKILLEDIWFIIEIGMEMRIEIV